MQENHFWGMQKINIFPGVHAPSPLLGVDTTMLHLNQSEHVIFLEVACAV